MGDANQDAVATEYCSNCKRDIPSINFVMHQSHCSRNIVLCTQCNEPVPRTEMEEHHNENHVKVRCKCGEDVEKCNQEEHDAEQCSLRQVRCEYCEMEMDFKDLAEHKDFCGSRTDPCPKCKRYIFFRDKAQHEASNCTYPEVKSTKPSPVESSLPRDQWHRTGLLFGQGVAEPPLGFMQQFSVPPFHRTRELGGEKRGVAPGDMRRSLSEGMAGDRKHRKNQDRVQNEMVKHPARGREKNEERALLQSTVNQEESDRRLAQHLAQDLSYDSTFSPDLMADEMYPSNGSPPYSDYQDSFAIQELLKESYSIPAINTFQEQSPALSDVTLPCEFCGQPIPEATLIQHQSGCRPDITSHPVPATHRANNSRQRGPTQPHPPSGVLNNLSYGASLPGYGSIARPDSPQDYSEDNLLMLPCEFCEVLLPADALPMHQVNCAENRTVTPAPATSAPATFDSAPGSHPARSGLIESPIRPTPQRVQRPQDFSVPNRTRRYQDEPTLLDPSIDDDEYEVDAAPVRTAKPHKPTQQPRQHWNPVFAPVFPPSGTNQVPPFARSPSEKYLHGSSRHPNPRPTATVTKLPAEGAVNKSKSKNAAMAGQGRHHEERPQSKSSARVQETLQELCDVPVISNDEELNNMMGTRLNRKPGGDRDSFTQIKNTSQTVQPKRTNLPPSSHDPSSLDPDDQLAVPSQLHPPASLGKPSRQQQASGARQKTRKPHGNSWGAAQGVGYTPSFPGGVNQRKGGDSERRGSGGAVRKSKQPSASTTVTLDPSVPVSSLRVTEESHTRRTANQQVAQRRRPAALKNTRYRDDGAM